MNDRIAQRIARQLGSSDLAELLSEKLSGSDLHSLLLAVIKRRVSKCAPSMINSPSAATRACDLDARLINMLEGTAYEAAPEYEAVELSPLTPVGSVSVLTGLDQANVLSTIRAFECASDPTVGMALECARRRKDKSDRKSIVRLCTNQRVVRFPVPDNPGFTAHFKLFSLVTAGRNTGSFSFETTALREHIGVYLGLLSRLQTKGFAFEDIVVELSDTRVVAHLCSRSNIDRDQIRRTVRARDSSSSAKLLDQYSITWPGNIENPEKQLAEYELPNHLMIQLKLLEQTVLAPLRADHPGTRFIFNIRRLTGLGYYSGPCFHIKMKNAREEQFMLADGGMVDWTQSLLSDSKERLLTSAIGAELICRLFRR